MDHSDAIELTATQPNGALACDTTIATADARGDLSQRLARGIVRPVRDLPDGVEVAFTRDAWDAVQAYVDLESRCCSFLTLAARRTPDAVLLTVTGRPEAREWIANIFATNEPQPS